MHTLAIQIQRFHSKGFGWIRHLSSWVSETPFHLILFLLSYNLTLSRLTFLKKYKQGISESLWTVLQFERRGRTALWTPSCFLPPKWFTTRNLRNTGLWFIFQRTQPLWSWQRPSGGRAGREGQRLRRGRAEFQMKARCRKYRTFWTQQKIESVETNIKSSATQEKYRKIKLLRRLHLCCTDLREPTCVLTKANRSDGMEEKYQISIVRHLQFVKSFCKKNPKLSATICVDCKIYCILISKKMKKL